jgi:hypothetical protein
MMARIIVAYETLLLSLLVSQVDAGAGSYCPAFIQGSVGQIPGVEAKAHGHSVVLDLALVARRSMDRTGTRHWRRGADFKVSIDKKTC